MIRTQPQLRLDCSCPMPPFSHSVTRNPRSANSSAVDDPMMPPPITTTSHALGRSSSPWTGTT
jgi:hypothetical protein